MEIKPGRPKNTKGSKWGDNVSPFTGKPLLSKEYKKHKTLLKKIKQLGLMDYVIPYSKVKNKYEHNEVLQSIANLKGVGVSELIETIIGNFVKEVKSKI